MNPKWLKRIFCWTATALLIIGSLSYWLDYENERRGVEPKLQDCKKQQHAVSGKKYIVSVCAIGYVDPEILYRLRIYSGGGALLAERFYRNVHDDHWSFGGGSGTAYWVDKDTKEIGYPDGPEGDFVKLPPTWLDWIRARLP